MKKKQGWRFKTESRRAEPIRRFVIDRTTGETHEIAPAGVHPEKFYEDLSLVEAARGKLRDLARRLEHPASTPEMHEKGEAMLEELAQLIAQATAAKMGGKIGGPKGAEIRRKAGDRKARLVQDMREKGDDPLTVTSERNLRRIKSRPR